MRKFECNTCSIKCKLEMNDDATDCIISQCVCKGKANWHEVEKQNGVECERYEQIYRMLLEWTRKELPETKIILLEPYVLPFGAVEPNWLPEMAERGKITEKNEHCGEKTELVSGIRVINNDAVNLISAFVSAVSAAIIWFFAFN